MYFEDSQWDDTLIGQFYERVKAQFPQKRQREVQEAQVRFSQAGELAAGVRRLPPRIQFVTQADDRMIQLNRDLLVVNQLRPYASFQEWENTLFKALGEYQDLVKPRTIARLGVRYIDRVVIPAPRVQMEDYFTLYPQIPATLGAAHGTFMLRVEIPTRRQGHRLLVTFGSAPPEKPNSTTFLLDFYDVVERGGEVDLEAIRSDVRMAHENVIEAFEATITDRLRTLFEPNEEQ